MLGFLGKMVDSNEKELKELAPLVGKIDYLEDEIKKL